MKGKRPEESESELSASIEKNNLSGAKDSVELEKSRQSDRSGKKTPKRQIEVDGSESEECSHLETEGNLATEGPLNDSGHLNTPTMPRRHRMRESTESSQSQVEEASRIEKQLKANANEILRRNNGLFFVHGMRYPKQYSKTSLFLFDDTSFIRTGMVWLHEWPWFDRLITLAILLNSGLIASTDFQYRYDPSHQSPWTPIQAQIDQFFAYIFIFECIVKVIAMGFVIHKNSYLRDPWNCLDFFIVMVSIIDLLGVDADSLKSLRTFRVLRPLRSVNQMPTMRDLIQSLLGSIPGLLNTLFFLGFIFSIFAIFGVNQFVGKTYSFCRVGDPVYDAVTGEFLVWPKADVDWLCATDADCERMLGEPSRCGSVLEEAGVDPVAYDDVRNIELIMYGIPNFDDFGDALVTIFQVLSLESWVNLMYNYQDASGPVTSTVFFLTVVIFGSFFTLNLVLAQIMDSFDKQQEINEEKAQMKREEEEREALRDAEKLRKRKERIERTRSLTQIVDESAQTPEKFKEPALKPEKKPKKDRLARTEPRKSKRVNQSEDQASPENQSEKALDENIQKLAEGALDEFRDSQKSGSSTETTEMSKVYDEEPHERDARERSFANPCYRNSYLLVTSVGFNFFVFCLILANTVTLALYTHDQSPSMETSLTIFNDFFTWIFVLEMILKMIGLGTANYVKDKYNLFDCILVLVSLIDWTLVRFPIIDLGSALKALKTFRLLRMMKLSKSWKALQDLLEKTVASLQAISSFSLLLFLFMFIFALLGMELYGMRGLLDENGELVIGAENIQHLYTSGEPYSIPRINFDNIWWALLSIFIVIIGEDWNWSMYQWTRAYSFYEHGDRPDNFKYWVSIIYFLILMIMGNIILFSLFTAILLKNFEEDMANKIHGGGPGMSEEDKELALSQSIGSNTTKNVKKIFSWENFKQTFNEAFGMKRRLRGEELEVMENRKEAADSALLARLEDLGKDAEVANNVLSTMKTIKKKKTRKRLAPELENRCHMLMHYAHNKGHKFSSEIKEKTVVRELGGRSLFIFGPTNCIRTFLRNIVDGWPFRIMILCLIAVSTVTLALENPRNDPESEMNLILKQIDFVMTIIFTVEAVIKIIPFGFLFCGPNSYMKEGWNVLDFTIVCSSMLGIFAKGAIDVSFLKSLRMLRMLRPLRVISRSRGLKVAITSLLKSIPSIVNLQIIVLFFLFLFAILQTTLFSGSFSRCYTEHLDLSLGQRRELIMTKWDCLNLGGEWVTPDHNFDDTMSSMLSLASIQSTEGWIEVLWDSIDAAGPNMQPQVNNNPFMAIYMMAVVIIICMLFLNLFVGVVIETFNREKNMLSYNQLLSPPQRTWISVQLMTFSYKPKIQLERLGFTKFRQKAVLITRSRWFDHTILVLIILNTFVLGFNYAGMPQHYHTIIEHINLLFVVIFTLEAILKLYAMRSEYFRSNWNRFDLSVVVLTIVILVVSKVFKIGQEFGALSTILRTLRIGRVFRLVSTLRRLQIIFDTLMSAMPSIASLGALLILLMFIASIIAMQQFALIGLEGTSELNVHVNFQTFGSSFLTLMRCATGEAWNSIMFDAARGHSILYQCEENESYATIVARGEDPMNYWAPKGCGKRYVSFTFFMVFQIMVGQIFLNLFIAIIIDAFFGQSDLAELPLSERSIKRFVDHWSNYDPDANDLIQIQDLPKLLRDLAKDEDTKDLIIMPDRLIANDEYMQRYLMELDIPTFDSFKEVMFHDVLQQLCNQVVKMHHNREQVAENKMILKVLQALTAHKKVQSMDVLTAMSAANIKTDYDVSFDELLAQMTKANSKIELVEAMNDKTTRLYKKFNNRVDTTKALIAKLSEEEKASFKVIKVYSTKHWMAAKLIMRKMKLLVEQRKREGDGACSGVSKSDAKDYSVEDTDSAAAYPSAHDEGEESESDSEEEIPETAAGNK